MRTPRPLPKTGNRQRARIGRQIAAGIKQPTDERAIALRRDRLRRLPPAK